MTKSPLIYLEPGARKEFVLQLTALGYTMNGHQGIKAWDWFEAVTEANGGKYGYFVVENGTMQVYGEYSAYLKVRTTPVNSPHHFFRYLRTHT